METMLTEALDAGFVGMSAQQLLFDKLDGDLCRSRTLPSTYAKRREMRALRSILRRRRRALQAGPDASHPHTILVQALHSIGVVRPARAAHQPAVGRGPQGAPVHHPPDASDRPAREPARRGLPLAAPAGAVRGVRRWHRPGDLRGVRVRRGRPAPAGEDRPRRADARPGVPQAVPQGLRAQVRPTGVAARLLRRRDRRVPRRLRDRQVLRPGRRRARRQAPGRRLPRPGARARHGDPLAHHDQQPPPRDPQEAGAGTPASRSASPTPARTCATWPSTTSAAAAQARPRRRAGRHAVHVGRARRAPAHRRARRLVPHRRRAPPRGRPGGPRRGRPGASRRGARGLPREPGRAVRRPLADGQPQRRRRPGRVRQRPPGGGRR